MKKNTLYLVLAAIFLLSLIFVAPIFAQENSQKDDSSAKNKIVEIFVSADKNDSFLVSIVHSKFRIENTSQCFFISYNYVFESILYISNENSKNKCSAALIVYEYEEKEGNTHPNRTIVWFEDHVIKIRLPEGYTSKIEISSE